jgi:hypothetical protein
MLEYLHRDIHWWFCAYYPTAPLVDNDALRSTLSYNAKLGPKQELLLRQWDGYLILHPGPLRKILSTSGGGHWVLLTNGELHLVRGIQQLPKTPECYPLYAST